MKQTKMKTLITFTAILFSIAILKGQENMIINIVNSNKITVAINDIQRITFDSDNMLLKTINGVESTYFLNDITAITFFDETIAIKDAPKNIEASIYINANGEIIVRSPYQINRLTVFDINGRMLMVSTKSNLNVNSLITGTYLLRVETAQGVITKKFIKTK